MKPIHVIYQAAGSPEMIKDVSGICRVCGNEDIGVDFNTRIKSSFTNHDMLVPGNIMCQACQFSFVEASDILMPLVGKDKPQRMRNYSHFVDATGTWVPLNKGQKSRMKEILFSNPKVAIIADSGQKHLIFRAKMGWLQFEEQQTFYNAEMLRQNIEVVEALYQWHNKDHILTGMYDYRNIMKCGVEQHLELERRATALRGGLYFNIAIFMATHGEEPDETE